MEDKASESVTEAVDAPVAEETPEGVEEVAMLGDDTFQPDGNGRVIGSNSASMTTATPGTDAVININATPFRSEDDDVCPECDGCGYVDEDEKCTCPAAEALDAENEDKIGPMSMAAESDGCCCGATKENPCECMGLDDQQPCSANKPMCPCYAAKSDDSHLGADTEEVVVNEEGEGSDLTFDDSEWETFELDKDLFRALKAHDDWDEMTRDGVIKVFRDNHAVHVSAPGPFVDDLLDMIIESHRFPMIDDDTYIDDRFTLDLLAENATPSRLRKNALLFTGFGALGLISAMLLYQRFNKEE